MFIPARRPSLLAGLLLAALAIGCSKAPETALTPAPTPSNLAQSWPAKKPTNGGSFTVQLRPIGPAIPNNAHFSLDVLVEPTASAASPVSVVVDADMPSHGHGMNTTAETKLVDAHRYRTDGMLFHMGGEWVITVEVATATGKERAHFPVTIE